jgi:HEPN domain-containing protein
MSQARPTAWWRQARNDLDLAPPHTHGLPKLVEVLEQQGVEASGLANLPLRALTRMTVTSRYPLEDTPPMDLFEPSDSQQAISTATAVLAWVERLDQGDS